MVLRLDKADGDDAAPAVNVQILQVAMENPEIRHMMEELSFRLASERENS